MNPFSSGFFCFTTVHIKSYRSTLNRKELRKEAVLCNSSLKRRASQQKYQTTASAQSWSILLGSVLYCAYLYEGRVSAYLNLMFFLTKCCAVGKSTFLGLCWMVKSQKILWQDLAFHLLFPSAASQLQPT